MDAAVPSSPDQHRGTALFQSQQSFSGFDTPEEELAVTFEAVDRAIKIIENRMNTNPTSFAQVANMGFVNVMNSLRNIVDAAGLSFVEQHGWTAMVQSQQSSSDDDSEQGAPAAAAFTSTSGGTTRNRRQNTRKMPRVLRNKFPKF